MLISCVEDEMSAEGRQAEDDAHEYQTASELFDLMAKNHPFEDVHETLSTRDLVILYKNIDLGTKLMSNAEEYKLTKKPNQHVESVVYNDEPDSDGSDSEIYGNDELRSVFMINKERLDLINGRPSLENTLCQKLGDLEIQASNLSFQYDQHFLFKDPYIKEQLKNLSQVDGDFDGTVLPASLLDYICCKRLEDNYNFYMDNIIRYVKHTIEQLKRISNGDYLTDKAKEKWREMEDVARDDDNTKVLATSTSIPLEVERKVNGLTSTWDDIIHSEVDVRSLSKILEKKIIVEVPKLICGSYKLFSKFCSDNLVISCKRNEQENVVAEKKESRLDVVLQLGRSESGQVMSNISSIMILQPTSPILPVECPKVLPLPPIQNEIEKVEKKKVTIVEIPEVKEDSNESTVEDFLMNDEGRLHNSSPVDDMDDDINFFTESKNNSMLESGDSSIALRDVLDTRAIPDVMRKEAPYNFISPDDLSLSMHKLNMSSLPEENEDMNFNSVNKKKSPTKVRIKSPYENKSHIIEEKKRKKLLEIREKREKKKMAVGENCKVTKHRYGKGAIMPQPSSSVTKLSITNKSFYNSIYGQNMNIEKQSIKGKGRRGRRELAIDAPLEQLEGEVESPQLTPEKNNKKYINRSYYLDEAVTEMMYTELKHSECSSAREIFSGSASAVSAEFSANVLSQIVSPPGTERNQNVDSPNNEDCIDKRKEYNDSPTEVLEEPRIKIVTSSKSSLNVPVPSNSPKDEEDYNEEDNNEEDNNGESKKGPPTLECRKSIDRLYELMKKIRQIDPLAIRTSKSKHGVQENSTVQGSDSGTSLKHHLTSSNPSSFSFEKMQNTEENMVIKNTNTKKSHELTTVVPKVIISTKQQTIKIEPERPRKDRKKIVMNSLPKVPDNPLKAISQLLHEFDSVQKTRNKASNELKLPKKPEILFDGRPIRPGSLKRLSRTDQPAREGRDRDTKGKEIRESEANETKNIKVFYAKEKRQKPIPAMEPLKIPHQQIPVEDKHIKKKIADILDEVKEAKGEAVRGPSKFNSRLNTLAQPKKSYVQAHSEEYQTKYGKNFMAERLHRAAATGAAPGPAGTRPKPRPRSEAASSVSVRPPPVQPLERAAGAGRRRATAGPEPPAPDARAQASAQDAPHSMKDKMVAVESYLKSHYGRASATMSNELLKARVPLVPNDLDIASVPSSPTGEESTAIGSKLHHMISMMNPKPPPLSALLEAHEPVSSKPSRENNDADLLSLSLADNYSHEPASSIDSDYRADIFEDKNVKTAVQNFQVKPKEQDDEADSDKSIMKYEGDSCNSSIELQKLEEAFNGRTTLGTFQKRLRIKNLTLTPKHSMRQLMVLESGDAGSIITSIKSTVSKSLKMSCSHSDNDIRTLANLGKAHLDWRFSSIPVQVATVGYAFPEYNSGLRGPNSSPIKSLDNIFSVGISVSSISNTDNKKSHKTSQCYKGVPQPLLKHDEQQIMVGPEDLPVQSKKQLASVSVATDVYVNHVVEEMCRGCTNLTDVNRSLKEVDDLNLKANPDNVDCTSSLDMLVGILNEIQKITTCHITNTEIYADEQECNELANLLSDEPALKATVKNNDSHELVSIASLDKLRQLESSPSIYSLYLSNDDKDSVVNSIGLPRLKTSAKSVLCNDKPDCIDKEVSADFPMRELATTFTDVPSKFFPITITHSTNVTSSLVDILSKPSSQTVISLRDYDILDSTFRCEKKIIEITEEVKIPNEIVQKPLIEYAKVVKKPTEKCKLIVEKKMPAEVRKVVTEIKLIKDDGKCYVGDDLDPMMKVKRDILVTVYSMLVLTVFAALSFPDILYQT